MLYVSLAGTLCLFESLLLFSPTGRAQCVTICNVWVISLSTTVPISTIANESYLFVCIPGYLLSFKSSYAFYIYRRLYLLMKLYILYNIFSYFDHRGILVLWIRYPCDVGVTSLPIRNCDDFMDIFLNILIWSGILGHISHIYLLLLIGHTFSSMVIIFPRPPVGNFSNPVYAVPPSPKPLFSTNVLIMYITSVLFGYIIS